jgi:hypothetical protein
LNEYSVESQESSREWTTPPKRTAVPRHATATWRPSLQGLNDSWEEVAGPRVETISPAVEASRFRSFQPQTSLRTIQGHSTRPVRIADPKDKTNNANLRSVSPPNPAPVGSSYLVRTSSVPKMRGDGSGPLPKATTPPQFHARPTGDISWAPPQQVMIKKQQRQQAPPPMMNTSTSSSEALYTVPPAAGWEEFNGSGFWRAQEI